mgnify:FL=1
MSVSDKAGGTISPQGLADTAQQAALPRLRSADLLSGGREAIIEHGKEQYRLRLTSNGKLILTK